AFLTGQPNQIEASRSLICDGIIDRRGSDTAGDHRSILKLATDRSMNAQRYICPRPSFGERNSLPCKPVGLAVNFNSSRRLALPGHVKAARLLLWHVPQSGVSGFCDCLNNPRWPN